MTTPDPIDWTSRDKPLGAPAAPVTDGFPAGHRPPPRRHTGRTVALIAAVALVLAGTTTVVLLTRHSGADQATAAQAPAANTGSATPSRAVEATPTAAAPLKLGQTVSLDPQANVTVYAYKQPIAAHAPEAFRARNGGDWGAADVKVCALPPAGANGIEVGVGAWALILPGGGLVQPTWATFDVLPQPAYPDDRQVPTGRCIRGWVDFEVPAGQRPTMVEYQIQAGTADWRA